MQTRSESDKKQDVNWHLNSFITVSMYGYCPDKNKGFVPIKL